MQQHREKMARENNRDFVPRLIVRSDGDVGRHRHLLEESAMVMVPLHEVPTTFKSGKSFRMDTLCSRTVVYDPDGPDFSDPPESCPHCSSEDTEVANIWWKGITWVYVYSIFHEQRDGRGAESWGPATRGQGEHAIAGFVEKVNAPQLMVLRSTIGDKVWEMSGRHGTLLDRDYDLVRNGKRRQPFYDLIPHDPTAETDEVKKVREALPDLGETIKQEFGQDQGKSAPTTASAPTTTAPAPATTSAAPPAAVEGEPQPAQAPRDDEPVKF